MKRFKHFRVANIPGSVWRKSVKRGHLPSSVLNKSTPESHHSWHRCWKLALDCYVDAHRSSQGEDDVLVLCQKSGRILAVIGGSDLSHEFVHELEPAWKSEIALTSSRETFNTVDGQTVFANYSLEGISWVTIAGAPLDVPCRLNLLERKARTNPDGVPGRLLARLREWQDYFGRGWIRCYPL